MFACSLGPNQQQPVPLGKDVVIGVPLAVTGNLSEEGGISRQGYEMFQDWVNSTQGGLVVQGVRHRVRFLFQDDHSSPQIDGQLAEQMITVDKVNFLLGPYGSANNAPVAAAAAAHHIPMVDSNGAASTIFTAGHGYVFGVQTTAARYLQPILDLAATMNPRPTTLAMFSANDPFSVEVARGATDYATSKGYKVVFNQQYPSGSTNLTGLLNQAKALKPDIIMNSGHLLEALAINKAAQALNLQAKIFAYSVGPVLPDFTQTLGQAANFVYTPSQWTPQAKYAAQYYLTVPQYVAAYRKKFNTQLEPNYLSADATAAGIALEEAIKHANSLQPDKVRLALQNLDIQTFFGRIKFDSTGQNSFKPMFAEQIQALRRQTVWPLEMASTAAQYPTPDWAQRGGIATVAAPPQATLPKTGAPPGRGG